MSKRLSGQVAKLRIFERPTDRIAGGDVPGEVQVYVRGNGSC